MKAFDALTEVGVKRRLGKVVAKALEQYDLKVSKIRFLDEATNLFYKIETETNEKFAAKVVQDQWIILEDNLIEAHILESIQSKSTVKVPTIVKNRLGEPVTCVQSNLTPDVRRVIIYEWFEGIDFEGHETDERFRMLGQVAAELHQTLEHIVLPEYVSGKTWDKVLYFKGEQAIYKNIEFAKCLPEDYSQVMDSIIDFLDQRLPRYYEDGPVYTIHGDLNPSNVKICGEELVVFDFEDHIQGTPLHDLAILLYYYWLDPKFDFESVKNMVLEGYERIKPFPDFKTYDLELLMTARRVNFLNYILGVSDQPEQYIIRNLRHVKDYMNRYGIKIV